MGTRICKCCKNEKPLSEFHSQTVKAVQYWKWECKECVKPAARARKNNWYYANQERATAYSRCWYSENKAHASAVIAQYKQANIGWWRNYQKMYMRKRRAEASA